MTAMLCQFLRALIPITQSLHQLYWPTLELLEVGHIRTKDEFLIYSCMVLLDGIYLVDKFNGNGHMKICHIRGYGCIENAGHGLFYYGLVHFIYFSTVMALIQCLWKSGPILILMVLSVLVLELLYELVDEECKDKVLIFYNYLLTHIYLGLCTP